MALQRIVIGIQMLLFAIVVFLSAFLLFQVQPMLAKYILPWFGGTPAVWTTCLLFFQTLLLAGYAYAHALSSRFTPRRQAIIHASVIGCSLLLMLVLATVWQSPITPGSSWKPAGDGSPVWQIVSLLTVAIGLPYFLLSTTGPLMQSWFARACEGKSPYRLYALSNTGSLLALVSYPFVVEPAITLRSQSRVWSAIYVIFAMGAVVCAWRMANSRSTIPQSQRNREEPSTPPAKATYALWIALPACASSMLLATTNEICQQVAVIPFLWILPLVLYLLSFILCFDSDRWYRRAFFHPLLGIAVFATCCLLFDMQAPILLQIGIYSLLLFSICMGCHGELVKLRPAPDRLTSFYLMISLGGAIGGAFVALVAPHVFRTFWEFEITVVSAILLLFWVLLHDKESWLHRSSPLLALGIAVPALLLPEAVALTARHGLAPIKEFKSYHTGVGVAIVGLAYLIYRNRRSRLSLRRPGWPVQLAVMIAIPVAAALFILNGVALEQRTVFASRNFYGNLAVVETNVSNPELRAYMLRHGRVVHGTQYVAPDKHTEPTTYFGPKSGIGILLQNHPARISTSPGLRIGIVGLGIGTISAYGLPGDAITFYEINPDVVRIANETRYFSYLRDCRAKLDIVPGDARLSMEREVESNASRQFDVLAVDAFSGDAIPVHLLTKEAFRIYLRELKDGGVLAVHISNQYLDLRPVLWRQAQEYGLTFAYFHASNDPPFNGMSDWVLLTRNKEVLTAPAIAEATVPHSEFTPPPLWTDDYSNLFQVLRQD